MHLRHRFAEICNRLPQLSTNNVCLFPLATSRVIGAPPENFVRMEPCMGTVKEVREAFPGVREPLSRIPGGSLWESGNPFLQVREPLSGSQGTPVWESGQGSHFSETGIGGVKTYRTLEGGGTRPESCPWKAWTFDPQIEGFL